jgi:methyl-accepting chemotaxis protein
MTIWANLSITKKLFLGVCLFAAGLLGSGVMEFRTLEQVKVNGPLYRDIVRGKDLVADILPPPEYIVETYLVALQLTHEQDPAQRQALTERCAALHREYATRHGFWDKDLPPGAMREALLTKSYGPAIEFYDLLEKQFLPAIAAGELEKADQLAAGPMNAAFNRHRAAIDETVALANTYASDTERRAAAVIHASTWQLLAMIGGLLAVVAAVMLFVARGVTRPLHDLFKGLRAFSINELKRVGAQFERLAHGMTQGMEQVNEAASHVATASQQLATGASEQASALEETATTLDEMARLTATNAEKGDQTRQLAARARQAAESGQNVMLAISASSGQIRKIIKVIEEIAFQTNLLALNAAVEAARAGEHGTGFAVVAGEVRNLAQRAAQAARETTGLIENSVSQADQGAAAIRAIVGDVAQVSDLVSGIAQSLQEQAQRVAQVSTAVGRMDHVTQENAAQSQESAAAAQQLSAQARTTKGLVDELLMVTEGRTAQ